VSNCFIKKSAQQVYRWSRVRPIAKSMRLTFDTPNRIDPVKKSMLMKVQRSEVQGFRIQGMGADGAGS
jgi:hypothetical protein